MRPMGLYLASVLWLVACGCRGELTVVEVISGDRVVLSDQTEVRYAGLEAPGKESPYFETSRKANEYLVGGKRVKLVIEGALSKGKEVLAYLYTPILVDGQEKFLFVNAELVRFGYVKALPVQDGCEKRELWQSLWELQEREAKPNGQNIWSQEGER